jgi:hypothetical protein
VITGWRGEGKSKQQIKEDMENFIKESIEKAKVKDCYNINKRKKLREKRETEKIFIDNDLTKQERKIQKKLRTIAKEEKGKGKK